MPIIKKIKNGKKCYQFGKKGKCYTGKNALEKALLQGRAIEWRKHRKK